MAAAAQARGRFWGADEDDNSGSDTSDASDGGGAAGAKAAVTAAAAAAAGGGRFAAYESDSESDDDGVDRVARSVHQRTYENLLASIRLTMNQLKISNWVGTLEEYEKLFRSYEKNAAVLNKEVRALMRSVADASEIGALPHARRPYET